MGRTVVLQFITLQLRFYEFYDASEAKITRKVAKYQRESCIILLQSETVLHCLHYIVMFLCTQEQGSKVNKVYMRFISLLKAM